MKKLHGPQGARVDEPPSADKIELGHSEPVLGIEFTEYIEPKVLTADELACLANQCGSYAKAAKQVGTSEAFVRYRIEGRKKPRRW